MSCKGKLVHALFQSNQVQNIQGEVKVAVTGFDITYLFLDSWQNILNHIEFQFLLSFLQTEIYDVASLGQVHALLDANFLVLVDALSQFHGT